MSKLKLFILIFFCLFMQALPLYASIGSSECKPSEIAKIKKNIDNRAIAALTNTQQTLDSYNQKALSYAQKCDIAMANDRGLGTPVTYSQRAQQTIITLLDEKSAGFTAEQINRPDSYKYTGVQWTNKKAKNQECQKLLNEAAKLQQQFNQQRNIAESMLGVRRNDDDVPLSCVCDENGLEPECVTYVKNIGDVQDQIKGCEPFSSYLNELTSCPLCPIFSVILDTDANLAALAWKTLAKSLQSVVLTFFLAYMALLTLKNISSPSGAGTGAYLRSILGLGLKVTITYLLLDNGGAIYGSFIGPVVQGGLEMGLSLLSLENNNVEGCMNKASFYSPVAAGALDAALLGKIYNTVDCFSMSAATMPAVGRALACYGWHADTIPEFATWFSGIVIYVFGVGIWMVIGFYLIDCTVQLGILCAVVPILIACWPFKITTKYAGKGVQMLMNTFFNFSMTGIMLVVAMKIIGYSAGGRQGDLSTFRKALNENKVEDLKNLARLDGIDILILIACCIFAFKLIGAINGIANKFSSGAGTDIGAKMGGTAASVAGSVAKGGLHVGGKAISTGAGYIAEATGLNNVGDAIANTALKGASAAGAKVGLKKFQPGAQQGMPAMSKPTAQGTKGGNTPNSNKPGGNTPNGNGNPNGGGNTPNGNTPNGNGNPNGGGNTPNGNTPNGGGTPNGNTPNGNGNPNGNTPNGNTPNGNTPNGDTPNGDNNSPYMFPPQEHNTGNAGMDAKLNQMDQNLKDGYHTGNEQLDKEFNDGVRKHRQSDEDFIKQRGYNMTGTEYRDAQQVLRSFDDTDKAKELNKQINEAAKNSTVDKNGARWYSDEYREAVKNWENAQHDYVKNNFNERTYQNCKTLQKDSNFVADDSKWKQ